MSSLPFQVPDYLIVFRNETPDTFGRVEVEIKPDNNVEHRPGEKLGPGEVAKLAWDVKGILGDNATIGRVQYVTPKHHPGSVGEGIIFGVGIEHNPEGFRVPEQKDVSFQTYIQHVGAAPVEWERPAQQDEPGFTKYLLVVESSPPYLVEIAHIVEIGGAPAKTFAIGVTIKPGEPQV